MMVSIKGLLCGLGAICMIGFSGTGYNIKADSQEVCSEFVRERPSNAGMAEDENGDTRNGEMNGFGLFAGFTKSFRLLENP